MELCRPPPPRPSARPSASSRLLLTVLQKLSGWLTTHPRGDHPPDQSWGGQPGRGWVNCWYSQVGATATSQHSRLCITTTTTTTKHECFKEEGRALKSNWISNDGRSGQSVSQSVREGLLQ